jgi:hypothetical protein
MQLEDLLRAHDALGARDGRREAVEEGRLAGLRRPGHEHVEPGADARLEERRRLRGQAAHLDEVVEPRSTQGVLADVDGAEAPGDALEHDVQPVAVGEHGVDEGLTPVDAAAAALEHPFDQLADLGARQHRRGQLVPSTTRDEDLARLVDPDLLDLVIVEVGLERAETRDAGDHLGDDAGRIRHPRHLAGEAPLVVRADRLLGQPAYGGGVVLRVDTLGTDPLTHLLVDLLDQRDVYADVRRGRSSMRAVVGCGVRHHGRSPFPS